MKNKRLLDQFDLKVTIDKKDMYTIDKDIPISPKHIDHEFRTKFRRTIEALKVGESFLIPNEEYKGKDLKKFIYSIRARLIAYRQSEKIPLRVFHCAPFYLEDRFVGIRVWKLKDKEDGKTI